MDRSARYQGLLQHLQSWARGNGMRVLVGKPCGADELAKLPKRFGAKTGFEPPPSYVAFLSLWSSWRLQADTRVDPDSNPEWTFVESVEIYSPAKAAAVTRATVRIPKGVTLGDRAIHTNHLVGFAATDTSPDCTWCFATDLARPEYPVLYHDQDEPAAARYVDSGELVDGAHGRPDFPDFDAWLEGYVGKVCATTRDAYL